MLRNERRVRAARPTRRPGARPFSPASIHIGSFYLPTYGVVLAIAYLTAIWLLRRKALAAGLPDQKVLDLSLYILASAILGAKLLLVAVEWRRYVANPRDLVEVLRSGGVFYGGLIARDDGRRSCTCASTTCRPGRSPTWARPSIALGEAIGRWGCFAAGCCYGKESHGPFAVTFTDPFAHEAVGTPLERAAPPDAALPLGQRLPDLPDPAVGLPAQDLRRRGLLALRAALRDHARASSRSGAATSSAAS